MMADSCAGYNISVIIFVDVRVSLSQMREFFESTFLGHSLLFCPYKIVFSGEENRENNRRPFPAHFIYRLWRVLLLSFVGV